MTLEADSNGTVWQLVIHDIWYAMQTMDPVVWDRNRVKWRGWCPANEMEYFA